MTKITGENLLSTLEWKWEKIEVGRKSFMEIELTPDLIEEYIRATGDDNPSYKKHSPFNPPIAPAILLVQLISISFESAFGSIPGAMHTKSKIEFINPVTVGQTLRIEGKTISKFIKRKRRYIGYESRCIDENGVEICRDTREVLVQYKVID